MLWNPQSMSFERRIYAQTQDLQIFKKFYMSQMNLKQFVHNTAYSVQLHYIAGLPLFYCAVHTVKFCNIIRCEMSKLNWKVSNKSCWLNIGGFRIRLKQSYGIWISYIRLERNIFPSKIYALVIKLWVLSKICGVWNKVVGSK